MAASAATIAGDRDVGQLFRPLYRNALNTSIGDVR